ncbi:hypothetical protein THAOC_32666 [Thalassiosira oceanica]|uniref:Legume lectin domain-containing protein n=1 Tax=Thalassiosira oceanica TaxID=159749 RepID=K0R6N1_THAOC|nr:hypothetical protein THAOC_32666 [Thalassiosira oceanica]|eukprot:EJK48525.1 hypothetical protein THAOC_32666 [Thalassiosira oceanica]
MIARKGLALLLTVPFLAADRPQSFFVGASSWEGNDANDAADGDSTNSASPDVGDGACSHDPSSPADGSCLASTAHEKPRDNSGGDVESLSPPSDDDEVSSEDDGSVNFFTRENWHTAGNNENRTVLDMWFNLKCDEVFGRGPRPIPTSALFAESIRLHNSIVTDESQHLDASAEGIHVGLEVRQADNKGRGLFATSRIDRGTRWRDAYTKTAIFYDPDHYRKFIFELEVDTACDVLQWSYGYKDDNARPAMAVDLDEATMCNDGGKLGGTWGVTRTILRWIARDMGLE